MKIKNIDNAKIESAIADFEKAVDCELIPVLSKQSSYVEHISWLISLLLLIFFIGAIDISFQDSWASKTWYYILAPLLAIFLGHLLDKSDLVDRFFISKKERHRQVMEKAQRIFLIKRQEVHKSRYAVLLYISIMERRIVVFPDPAMQLNGIEDIQNKLLEILQNHFKKGHFELGFLDAINYLKTILTPQIPNLRTQNENPYSNKLIWWHD